MTTYRVTPGIVPKPTERELQRVAQALSAPSVMRIELETLYAVPSKLYDGLTVLADGTTWNPGSGQGVYTYYAGAWNYLG